MSCTTPVFDNLKRFVSLAFNTCWLSEIGTVVKVTDSHLCGWSSIPGKSCIFSHSHLKQELINVLHVFWSACKILMPRGFPLTSSLLLNYQVQQYTRTYMYTWTYTRTYTHVLIHTRVWTYMRTYTRTYTSTHLQAYLHTYVHGYTIHV